MLVVGSSPRGHRMKFPPLSCLAAALILSAFAAGAPASEKRRDWTLDALVETAVAAHPEVAARRAEIDAAQAGVESARWQFYPTPSVQMDQHEGRRATVLRLQQPLWTGGRLSADLEAAQGRSRVAQGSLAETRLDLALRVTDAYGTFLSARWRAEAAAAGVERLKALALSLSRRVEAGVSPAVDGDLLQARMAQIRADLELARASERAALERLRQLTGLALEPQGLAAPAATPGPVATDGLVERALAAHPALRRNEAEIELARSQVEQAKSALWPSVSLRGEHQDGAIPGSLPAGRRLYLSLQYTPGAGLAAGSQIRAAEARAAALKETREAIRRDVAARVAAQIEEHAAALERTRDADTGLAATTEVMESYTRLFLAGKRGWLDVLNAARELIQSEQFLAETRVQALVSAYRLTLYEGGRPWQGREGS